MKKNAVLVDVAIDQGGCFETSQPDHAPRPGLRGGGDHPLLRREHARRGADHLDLRADQRHASLRPGPRGPRRGGGGPPRSRPQLGVNVSGGTVTHPAVAEAVGATTRRSRTCSAANRKSDQGGEMATATAEKQKKDATEVHELKNIIGGESVDPAEGETEDVFNPATGEVIAEAPLSTEKDVDRAVKAARKAFETWQYTTPGERAQRAAEARRRDPGARRGDRRLGGRGRRQAARRRCSTRRSRRWWTSCASSPAPRATMEGRAAGEYMEGHTSYHPPRAGRRGRARSPPGTTR